MAQQIRMTKTGIAGAMLVADRPGTIAYWESRGWVVDPDTPPGPDPTDYITAVELGDALDAAGAVTVKGTGGAAGSVPTATQVSGGTVTQWGAALMRRRSASIVDLRDWAGLDLTGGSSVQSILDAAVDQAPSGGTIVVPNGTLAMQGAWDIDKTLAIVGESSFDNFYGLNESFSFDRPDKPPHFLGSVLLQTQAGANGLTLSKAASTVHLRNLGIRFADPIRFVNTGHGVDATPSTNYTNGGTGHDHGILGATWDNVRVWGHDGNHYGFRMVNTMYCTLRHLRAFGGGVFECISDSYAGNYGNLVAEHLMGNMFCGGTAHGYHLKGRAQGGAAGVLGLMTFIRPQVNVTDQTARYPTSTPPTTAQYRWLSSEGGINVTPLTVISPDLESPAIGNPVLFGTGGSQNIDRAGLGVPDPGTPAVAVGVGAGTGATVSINGGSNDNAGQVTLVTGSTAPTTFSDLFTLTWGRRTSAKAVLLVAKNSAAAACNAYLRSQPATGVTVGSTVALSTGATAIWGYSVVD